MIIHGKSVFFSNKIFLWRFHEAGYSSELNQTVIATCTVTLPFRNHSVLHQESQDSGRDRCCEDEHIQSPDRNQALHGDLLHLNTHSQNWQVIFSQVPPCWMYLWMYVNAMLCVLFGTASAHQPEGQHHLHTGRHVGGREAHRDASLVSSNWTLAELTPSSHPVFWFNNVCYW